MLSKQLKCTSLTAKKHISELEALNLLVPTSKGWYEVVGNMRFKAISNSVGITCISIKSSTLNNRADFLTLIKLAKIQAASLGLQKIEDKKAQKYSNKKKKEEKKKDESISGNLSGNSMEASKEAEKEYALSAAVSSRAVSKVINAFAHQRGFSESSVRSTLVKANKKGLVYYIRSYNVVKCNDAFSKASLGFKNIGVKINNSKATASEIIAEFKNGSIDYQRRKGESPLFFWRLPNSQAVAIATETVSEKAFDENLLSKSYHEKKYNKAVQKYGLGTLNYSASKKHFLTELDKANKTVYFIKYMNKAKGRA